MRISDWSSDVCSSDLPGAGAPADAAATARSRRRPEHRLLHLRLPWLAARPVRPAALESPQIPQSQSHRIPARRERRPRRSEEHTSELQSLMRISYAVFCLKKKNKITINTHTSK